jgi:hypothetical protein
MSALFGMAGVIGAPSVWVFMTFDPLSLMGIQSFPVVIWLYRSIRVLSRQVPFHRANRNHHTLSLQVLFLAIPVSVRLWVATLLWYLPNYHP